MNEKESFLLFLFTVNKAKFCRAAVVYYITYCKGVTVLFHILPPLGGRMTSLRMVNFPLTLIFLHTCRHAANPDSTNNDTTNRMKTTPVGSLTPRWTTSLNPDTHFQQRPHPSRRTVDDRGPERMDGGQCLGRRLPLTHHLPPSDPSTHCLSSLLPPA